MRAILLSFSIEGIVVIGMTILLIVGGIDLSVGSVVCLSMVIGGTLFLAGLDPWTASLIAIAACGFIGFLMGLCVTPHRSAFLHRLAGLHGDHARAEPALHARHAAIAVLAAADVKFVGQGSLGGVPS
jgi:ribose transport system permease protein